MFNWKIRKYRIAEMVIWRLTAPIGFSYLNSLNKQLIHKRDRYCKSYKKSGNSQLREKYVSLRHSIKRKIKDSHEAYLEGLLLLGMDGQTNQTVGQADSKKLFQYLKNSRTNQQGIPPLKQNGNLHTESKDKANILNQQFQSVFTPLAPCTFTKRAFSHESARPCR